MQEVLPAPASGKQNRGFVLGSLSFGHGVAHLYDQGFPVFLPVIAASLGMSNLQVAGLLGVRQVGFGVVNLGGGVFVDMLRNQWGLILTGCMVLSTISFLAMGASPTFAVLLIAVIFVSIPGALWHLPATAALSQRFPDRRGFAISVHGFGSSVGNLIGPIMAGALLTALLWRHVLFIYAAPAMLLGIFVWWSLRDVGREGPQSPEQRFRAQVREAWMVFKNPVVLALVLSGALRGVALQEVFHWTPFYLEQELGMGHFLTGVHYALLTGTGIVAAPILGHLSDAYGRKMVLVPGLVAATLLSLVVVSTGDSLLLAVSLAAMGLFSFSLHQIILAAVLDVTGRGTEATSVGLIFGFNGVIGGLSPFIASLIIDHMGGFGSIFYYSGILTAASALVVMFVPLPRYQRFPG